MVPEATEAREAAGPAAASLPRAIVRTARPRQWPKNLLVAAAPLAGGELGHPGDLVRAAAAGLAFLLASVAVYAANDVADAERDRVHPAKRSRPVAAGELPERYALTLAVSCAIPALGVGFVIGRPLLSAVVAGYLMISFGYSLGLKHVPGLEVVLVASGFLLRVLAGAAATRVGPSGWFLLVCSCGALGVAIAKRYAERVTLGEDAPHHRPVMRAYRASTLRAGQYAAAVVMTFCYLRWAYGEPGSTRAWHLVSAVPLAAALCRFAVLTGRPAIRPVEDMIARDSVMVTCEVVWLLLFMTGLYFG
jgi:decaprenyl-phosphate phosphoribosyltransferase